MTLLLVLLQLISRMQNRAHWIELKATAGCVYGLCPISRAVHDIKHAAACIVQPFEFTEVGQVSTLAGYIQTAQTKLYNANFTYPCVRDPCGRVRMPSELNRCCAGHTVSHPSRLEAVLHEVDGRGTRRVPVACICILSSFVSWTSCCGDHVLNT